MLVTVGPSWSQRANERYQRQVTAREDDFKRHQEWLFDHRDRVVTADGHELVVRLRPRSRSLRDASLVALAQLVHGLRQLGGDLVRLASGARGEWVVGVVAHNAFGSRVLYSERCGSEADAIARADALVEEIASGDRPWRA